MRVWRQSFGNSLLIEGLELGLGEDDLAANLEADRRRSRDTERNAANCPHVESYVLAHHTITPRRPACEEAVLVGKGHRQAIQL